MPDGDIASQDTRRQRGGRNQRREERSRGAAVHRPYIVRGIPTYDILSEESLARIEATADRILAEIGIELREDAEAMRLYKAAGAEVSETAQDVWRVKFEPGMCREILRTAPAEFTQHARNPANNVRIGGRNVVFAPSCIFNSAGARRTSALASLRLIEPLARLPTK